MRRCQVSKPTLDDMTDFIVEETILMNDPLFSHESLADYQTKLEQPVKQKQMKNYTIKAEDEKDKKVMKGSSEDKSSRCKMCTGRHDLDECKTFNGMTVEERSKFLFKQNFAMVAIIVYIGISTPSKTPPPLSCLAPPLKSANCPSLPTF